MGLFDILESGVRTVIGNSSGNGIGSDFRSGGGFAPTIISNPHYPVPSGEELRKISEFISEVFFEPKPQPDKYIPAITEDEKKHLLEIIEQGRRSGCKELRIHVKREHANLIAASGKILIDLPLDISASVEEQGAAGIYLLITYFDHDPLARIDQLHGLLQRQAITQEEFDNAKAALLSRV